MKNIFRTFLIFQKRKQIPKCEDTCLKLHLMRTYWVLGMGREAENVLRLRAALGRGQIGKQMMSVQGGKCCNIRMDCSNIREYTRPHGSHQAEGSLIRLCCRPNNGNQGLNKPQEASIKLSGKGTEAST